jgi:hypothetical protein
VKTERIKLESILAGIKKILSREDVEDFNATFNDISSTAFIISAEYYTSPVTHKEFLSIKESINLSVLKLLEDTKATVAGAGTEIPPQQGGTL